MQGPGGLAVRPSCGGSPSPRFQHRAREGKKPSPHIFDAGRPEESNRQLRRRQGPGRSAIERCIDGSIVPGGELLEGLLGVLAGAQDGCGAEVGGEGRDHGSAGGEGRGADDGAGVEEGGGDAAAGGDAEERRSGGHCERGQHGDAGVVVVVVVGDGIRDVGLSDGRSFARWKGPGSALSTRGSAPMGLAGIE